MKVRASAVIIIALSFLAACSNVGGENGAAQSNKGDGKKGDAAAVSEKNKQIAVRNEATRATEAAQLLEQQGRQMEADRRSASAAHAQLCKTVEEDLQGQVRELETKIKSFPEPFASSLAPMTRDLSQCVSCSKQAALPACVRARASINEAINRMFAR